ncbi:acyl-CoA dehydrogenase [Acrocarpospora pleiomorpha]|uniref:Acyl-CoA dehydrogenase n=1 Tax=Acrocarpospora pleiomorpha TaxID=90975 RepID=A0A5M3XS21_9ACTN|nr:acyl-CoA dehydrogenase family protein [Acrocarpospora pleiomorpha]GES22023.1 acyl-CoA dehydrogenase [Acrocarpospora pleiomorpha]
MNVPLDEEQRDLLELTRRLLAEHAGEPHLRRRMDLDAAHDPGLWRRLAGIGLTSVVLDERWGGAGLGEHVLAPVLHLLGEFAVPEPILETITGALLIQESCPEDFASTWLPRIASGDALVSLSFGARTPVVPYAASADLLLLCDGDVTAVEQTALVVERQDAVDPLHPLYRVAGEGRLVSTDAEAVERAWTRLVAGSACLLTGVSTRLLDMTVGYVKTRHQFGRPVGSFQAVKHKLADVATAVDLSQAAAFAAFRDTAAPDAAIRAAVAKAYAGEAAKPADVAALQLHGGIGFTLEYGLQFWLKRSMSVSAMYGTVREHRRALAERLLAR